uniref:Uncharacterized protein n=1 Tax=Anguilla anguilla TaxID=7936 RepID=A0A0E9UNK7_ANGAN
MPCRTAAAGSALLLREGICMKGLAGRMSNSNCLKVKCHPKNRKKT